MLGTSVVIICEAQSKHIARIGDFLMNHREKIEFLISD